MPEEIIEPEAGSAPEGVVEPEPFTLPEDFATRVQSWDIDLESLPEAVDYYKRLQNEEGVIETFIQTGQSLGFGVNDLQKLFGPEEGGGSAPAPTAAPVPAAAPPDPEELLSRREVEEYVSQVRAEFAQSEERRAAEALQARQDTVRGAMGEWFKGQEIEDESVQFAIANLGQKHVLPGQDVLDPKTALAALEKGKLEYDRIVEAEAQRYLQKKGLVVQGSPTNIGGSQTHAGDGGEQFTYEGKGQKALETAKDRVRKKLAEAQQG